MNLLEAIEVINPSVIAQARRFQVAVMLIQEGRNRREISGIIQRRFGVDQSTAWRDVDKGLDVAGAVDK